MILYVKIKKERYRGPGFTVSRPTASVTFPRKIKGVIGTSAVGETKAEAIADLKKVLVTRYGIHGTLRVPK